MASMPSIEISSVPAGNTGDELLAIPFCEGAAGPEPGHGAAQAGRAAGVGLADLLALQGFHGRAGETAVFLVSRPAGDAGPRRIAAVGVGPAEDAGAAAVRDAAQRLASIAAGSARVATTLALLGLDRAESVRAAAEGFLLGAYRPPRAGSRPVGGERPTFPATLTLLTSAAGNDGRSW